MATKKTTTRTTKTTVKKPTAKSKRTVAPKSPRTDKVDYYPNRMTVGVSVLAGTVLVLMAVIAVFGSR